MATNALTCSASTLVSNNMVSRSLLPVGLGRHSVSLPPTQSSKAPSSRPSLVVKAEQGGGSNTIEVMEVTQVHDEHPQKRVALVNTVPFARPPWKTTENENDIRMWFDMAGIEDIKVSVVNDRLVIEGYGGQDVYGDKIFSRRETKIPLPFNACNEEIVAEFKEGVLYITVPKIIKAEHKDIDVIRIYT